MPRSAGLPIARQFPGVPEVDRLIGARGGHAGRRWVMSGTTQVSGVLLRLWTVRKYGQNACGSRSGISFLSHAIRSLPSGSVHKSVHAASGGNPIGNPDCNTVYGGVTPTNVRMYG